MGTRCAAVGDGRQFRSDDLDDADWAAVRPAEQPAQPELGRRDVDIEAGRTTEQQKHEAGQLHLIVLVRAPGPSKRSVRGVGSGGE